MKFLFYQLDQNPYLYVFVLIEYMLRRLQGIPYLHIIKAITLLHEDINKN